MGDYWSEEEVDRLEELRCEGLSFDEMAPHLGRSGRAVKAKYATLREHSEFDWEAKAKLGSAKLLSALKKHHDPDEVCVEEPELPAPEPVPEPQPEPELLTDRQPTVKNIRAAIARRLGVRDDDLGSQRRTNDIIYPRQLAYYMCRLLTLHSYQEIGRRFGGRDHASVLHGCRKIEAAAKTDPKIAEDIEAIKCTFDCENEAGGAS